MPESYKILAQALIPSTNTTIYTVPASTQTIIKHMIIANPSGGDVSVFLYHNGSSAVNTMLPGVTVVAGGFAENDAPSTMNAGDTIVVRASVNSALTITLHGVEIS